MRLFPICLALGIALIASGCHRDASDTTTDTTPPAARTPSSDATGAGTTASDTHTSADTAPPSPAPAPPPSPGASLAWVAALDEHEIAAVEQAHGRLGPAAREYARMLHREHSENLAAARALSSGGHLIAPEMTTEVHGFVGKGKAILEELAASPRAGYERAWLQAMVDGHAEALAVLDTRLIPAAKDEPLRNFLNNTRDHMAMHLERGRALLESSGVR